MNKKYGVIVLLLTLATLLFFMFKHRSAKFSELDQADASYRKAEQSDSVAARNQGFTEALKIYEKTAKDFNPLFGTGKLYYNMGNTLYQLGEYPRAIFYYYRALLLIPHDRATGQNLNQALSKVGQPPFNPSTPLQKIFFLHEFFSLPQRLEIFAFFALAATVLGSLWIWSGTKLFKITFFLATLGMTVMLCSVLFTFFFHPTEAVVIKTSPLRVDAGEEYAFIPGKPEDAGTKVTVLSIIKNGKWLKVKTQDGKIGFIPYDKALVI